MNAVLQAFDFESLAVRVVIRDEQPWFCGADVCRVLSLGNPSQAIKGNEKAGALGLDADEWDVYNLDTSSASGVQQERGMLVISESGLYALIFKSRKPEARRFRKWVTSEVLPAIRRGGAVATGDVVAARNIAEWLESLNLGLPAGVEVREAMIRRVWQSAEMLGWRVHRQTDGWAVFPQPVLDNAMALFAARDLRPALGAG